MSARFFRPPERTRLGPVHRYALSLLAVAAAVLLRTLLDPYLGDALPLVTLFGAVAAAVWIGGYRPAIVGAAIGYIACDYLFISPRGALGTYSQIESVVGSLAYCFTCALIIGLGEMMRIARRRESEGREMLTVTLRSIGDGVITTDIDGRVNYLNDIAVALTGWTPDEARGRPLDAVFRVINESTRQPVANPAMRSLRDGAVVGLANHTLLIRKDGSELPIGDSAAPIRDTSGHLTGCVLIFRDVTAQRVAERERAARLSSARMLAAIVESSDDAIISKSLDGVIQSWNAAAERLFGYQAADVVGRHISIIIAPERLAEEEAIIADMKLGRRIEHLETERLHRDGRRIIVSLTVSPVRNDSGEIVGASTIVRDMTERQRIETDRKRMEDNLRKLADDLSEADRRKNEFLATLAHELRNPLAPLSNMLEVMKRADGDRVAIQKARDTMERQLAQLVRLVDDLLDVNRITHDRLELRPVEVELSAIVRQAVEAVQPLIDSERHVLAVSMPPEPIWLRSDPARLAQVVGNLLHNSVKYTRPGGRITLSMSRDGGDAVIAVRDDGIGIPPDKIASIFDMFMQVDRSHNRSQGGLGIGLTLVKRLVEMHGGSVVASSAGTGQGSEFVVRLPALAQPSVTPALPPASATPQRRVLVVDDNRDSAESLALLLEIAGHSTLTAHDGSEALRVAEQARPDVILLDIGLPGISGHEVCERLRGQPWGRDMRIIALTGWGQAEDRRRSEEAGFDGHLVKPADYDKLVQLLA